MKTGLKVKTKNLNKMATDSNRKEERRTLKSITELAEFLGCSRVTAQNYKNSGRIPYMQIGRTIIFEVDKVTAALERKCKN